MRHQVGLGRRSTSPIFTEPFASVSVVLGHATGGGLWGSHTQRVRLSLSLLHIFYGWRLLRALFCADST